MTTTGSSPLSRGIRCDRINYVRVLRIIPALAGNTHSPSQRTRDAGDHPRSRGEYWTRPAGVLVAYGSSPLSRGIPTSSGSGMCWIRIIPALAGNTG